MEADTCARLVADGRAAVELLGTNDPLEAATVAVEAAVWPYVRAVCPDELRCQIEATVVKPIAAEHGCNELVEACTSCWELANQITEDAFLLFLRLR